MNYYFPSCETNNLDNPDLEIFKYSIVKINIIGITGSIKRVYVNTEHVVNI